MFTDEIEKFNERFEAIEKMIVVLTGKVMDAPGYHERHKRGPKDLCVPIRRVRAIHEDV